MTSQTGDEYAESDKRNEGLGERLRREADGARAAGHDVRDDISDRASRLAADAKAAAGEQAEEAQRSIGAGLKSIGGALRAAGEHLSNERQATASRIANDAAANLERLSETLQNRSIEEVVSDLRSFGRNNAGGMFAGSLLAGLAVGRLLKLAASADSEARASSGPGVRSNEAAQPEDPGSSSSRSRNRDEAEAATRANRASTGSGPSAGQPVEPARAWNAAGEGLRS